jgi:ligand-binding SRPBCC domain-containing protein
MSLTAGSRAYNVREDSLFRLKESIHVNAPIERCFLLSTSIELVRRTLKMKPVKGKTSGFIVNGDELIWRGFKFGIPAFHETLITQYDRPNFFQDTMGKGYFKHFQHDHHFKFIDGRTLMYDIVRFSMPLGRPGREIGKRIVVPHVLELMTSRFEMIKRMAETEEWKDVLTDPALRAAAEYPADWVRI